MIDADVDVFVSAPVEQIVVTEGTVGLQNIFLQNMFDIVVVQDGRKVSFEVNLPEWLEALTNFLRVRGVSSMKSPLVLSGDRFEAQRADGVVQIRVCDLQSNETTWLRFTDAQAENFHAILLAELCAAVDRAAGRHLDIEDLARVKLN
jgi:hypothetical protein